MVRDADMLKWCVEHGASVHLDITPSERSERSYDEVLESVAAYGSISTFEFLRGEGAPLGMRALHLAV